MSSKIALLLFPLFFLVILDVIFGVQLTQVYAEQFVANCPYPIFEGTVSNIQSVPASNPIRITYNINHGHDINGNITNDQSKMVGTVFRCEIDHTSSIPTYGVVTGTREYGDKLFSAFPWGYLGYLSDYLSTWGVKAGATLNLTWTYFNAPAIVTSWDFFTVINLVLAFLTGLGGFLALRGG